SSRPLNHNIHGVIRYTLTAFLSSWRSSRSDIVWFIAISSQSGPASLNLPSAQRSIQVVYLISHSAICALESCLACMYQPPKMSFGSILITPTDIFCMDINVYDSPVSNLICIHIRLPSFTAAMDAGGLHTSSAPTGELPSQGWNERALNSSLGDQTLTSLTAPDLNTTPPLNSVAINHNNTTNPNNTTTSTTSARLDRDEARNQVGALWDTKPDEEKKRYRDPAFLKTLRPMTTDRAPSDDPQD
ncbi:hypothetical protein MJO29_014153, partial [Puccinia striiformis f. sp. tritici]